MMATPRRSPCRGVRRSRRLHDLRRRRAGRDAPQTLRMYEARGLIEPKRSPKGTRLYSQRDVDMLRRIQEMTSDLGLNLAGVERVLELEQQLERATRRLEDLEARSAEMRAEMEREIEAVRSSFRAELVPTAAPRTSSRRDRRPSARSRSSATRAPLRGQSPQWRRGASPVTQCLRLPLRPQGESAPPLGRSLWSRPCSTSTACGSTFAAGLRSSTRSSATSSGFESPMARPPTSPSSWSTARRAGTATATSPLRSSRRATSSTRTARARSSTTSGARRPSSTARPGRDRHPQRAPAPGPRGGVPLPAVAHRRAPRRARAAAAARARARGSARGDLRAAAIGRGQEHARASAALADERVRLLAEDTPLLDARGHVHPFPLRIGVNPTDAERMPEGSVRRIERMEFHDKLVLDLEGFRDRVEARPSRWRTSSSGSARSGARAGSSGCPGAPRHRRAAARGRRRRRRLPGDGVRPAARHARRRGQARRGAHARPLLRRGRAARARLAADARPRPASNWDALSQLLEP